MVDAVECDDCHDSFHRTASPPQQPFVRIEALRCRQKGKAYFLTDLNADVLDLLTDVPRFDWELSYKDMADAILKYGLGLRAVEAWQRDLIPGKLDSISRWWEEAKSSLVNAVV